MIEYVSLADAENMKRFTHSFTLSGKITKEVCSLIIEMCEGIDGASIRLPPFMKYITDTDVNTDITYLQIMTDEESVATMFALRFPDMFSAV